MLVIPAGLPVVIVSGKLFWLIISPWKFILPLFVAYNAPFSPSITDTPELNVTSEPFPLA